MTQPFIHPNTPPKLAAKFKRAKSYHVLAEQIDVNVRYVFELIADGKEPNDTTPALREIRKKLHLSARKAHRRRAKPKEQPAHRKWWNEQGPAGRDSIIKQTYELNKDRMP